MSVIITGHPGVFSDYENSGTVWAKQTGGKVGIVAVSSLAANTVRNIKKESQAKTLLGDSNTGCILSELVLKNGAREIVFVSAGSSGDAYESAFNVLRDEDDICTVICDSDSSNVHALLKASVLSACENLKERVGIIACSADQDDKESWAQSFNSERIILTAQNTVDEDNNVESGCILSAALAGVIAGSSNLTVPFNSVTITGITGALPNLESSEVDDYISFGITPFETLLNEVKIIRCVTSKTTTEGTTDSTFKEINTVLMYDKILKEIRNMLVQKFTNMSNNDTVKDSIRSQVTIKLNQFLNSGFISEYTQPNVYSTSLAPSISVVELGFTLKQGMNQVHINANIEM